MTQPPPLSHLALAAWPEGLADADRALLARLSADEERLLSSRLAALLDVEAGAWPASRAPVGDPKGITDSGFQSLVRRWRADRALRTLMPYAGRTVRRRGDTPVHRAVMEAVDALLAADPDMALTRLAKEAAARSGTGLAPNSVKLIARERRAALRSNGAWIAARYGAAVLSDVSALAAGVVDSSGGITGAVIALVVEGASGIVLGHAVGPIGSALDLQRGALADALARIVVERLDVASDEPSSLQVVVAPGEDARTLEYARSLRAACPVAGIVNAPRRRSGDRAADLLDGAIDVLRLRPRGGRPTRRATASTWDETRLVEVAAEAVATHNSSRIAILRSAMPDEALTSIGRMVAALTSVVDAG